MKTIFIAWICFCFLTFSDSYAQNNLEIPATRKGKKELILKRMAYTLSFNTETNIPNWVAWKLNKERLA